MSSWLKKKKKKKRQLLSRTLYSLDQTLASWAASGCHDNQSCSGWEAAGCTGCCNFQKGKKKRRVRLLVLSSGSSLSESWVKYADTLLDRSWGGVPLGLGKNPRNPKSSCKWSDRFKGTFILPGSHFRELPYRGNLKNFLEISTE